MNAAVIVYPNYKKKKWEGKKTLKCLLCCCLFIPVLSRFLSTPTSTMLSYQHTYSLGTSQRDATVPKDFLFFFFYSPLPLCT